MVSAMMNSTQNSAIMMEVHAVTHKQMIQIVTFAFVIQMENSKFAPNNQIPIYEDDNPVPFFQRGNIFS